MRKFASSPPLWNFSGIPKPSERTLNRADPPAGVAFPSGLRKQHAYACCHRLMRLTRPKNIRVRVNIGAHPGLFSFKPGACPLAPASEHLVFGGAPIGAYRNANFTQGTNKIVPRPTAASRVGVQKIISDVIEHFSLQKFLVQPFDFRLPLQGLINNPQSGNRNQMNISM